MKTLVSVWLLFLGILATAFWAHHNIFVIKNIQMKVDYEKGKTPGAQKTQKELEAFFQSYKGQAIYDLPLSKIRQWLKSQSQIQSFRVQRVYPDQLKVYVSLKSMALTYLDQRGYFYPVSENGEILSFLKKKKSFNKVILRGSGFLKKTERAKKAISLVRFMDQFEELKEQNISEVFFDEEEGFSLFLSQKPVEIKLGFFQLEKKIKKVRMVLRYLEKQKVKSCVIDARLGKKVVVKLRNET